MLATSVPLAATAGTPIPGQIESPVHSKPDTGVLGPAKVSRPGRRWRITQGAGEKVPTPRIEKTTKTSFEKKQTHEDTGQSALE